ncbi:MAG: tRNA uridine-5-carboxymethylaminomethyl(34) synthesis GTPase MnmE [Spirochaetales bacterium]|nr:tRNA uridine-5-carboxymethylaminomethyl(34) synthesis GTPase MnmE [Spirochaetales bacterium]
MHDPDDAIAAPATPWGISALAVIRTTGCRCIEKVSTVFKPSDRLKKALGGMAVYGEVFNPADGSPADQVIALVFRAPASYTGQDTVELCCHGGIPSVRKVLDALKAAGFRDAGPGEFTLRAFLNGKVDLTQAEAVNELITAKTRRAHDLAFNRLSGALWKKVDEIKQSLVEVLSALELTLDYPEDEIEEPEEISLPTLSSARGKLQSLLKTYRTGRLFQQGIRLALAGRTNAGKSSLFNLLLREDRAIVSEIHGTTRDYLESWITMNGLPVLLLDTAGLRASDHPVEAEGIRRSEEIIENADLVLYLVDASRGLSAEDREYLEKSTDRVIPVWSKADIAAAEPPEGFLPVSTVTDQGREDLERRIYESVLGTEPLDAAVIDSERQKDCLTRALEALERFIGDVGEGIPLDAASADLKEAVDALGEITGEVTSSDILQRMFSRFCVGK